MCALLKALPAAGGSWVEPSSKMLSAAARLAGYRIAYRAATLASLGVGQQCRGCRVDEQLVQWCGYVAGQPPTPHESGQAPFHAPHAPAHQARPPHRLQVPSAPAATIVASVCRGWQGWARAGEWQERHGSEGRQQSRGGRLVGRRGRPAGAAAAGQQKAEKRSMKATGQRRRRAAYRAGQGWGRASKGVSERRQALGNPPPRGLTTCLPQAVQGAGCRTAAQRWEGRVRGGRRPWGQPRGEPAGPLMQHACDAVGGGMERGRSMGERPRYTKGRQREAEAAAGVLGGRRAQIVVQGGFWKQIEGGRGGVSGCMGQDEQSCYGGSGSRAHSG